MKEADYLYCESPFADRNSAMFDDIDSKDDVNKTSTGL